MSATPVCPKCGRGVEPNAIAGLCPPCLLQAGLEATSARTTPFPATPFTAPALAELAPHFPQFELLEPLGQGGMGAVYKARHTRLDRLVALKILPKDADKAEEFANRFAREARALARLSHSNIVIIHDYGEAGGWFYFVMEFVEGVNLRAAIKARTVQPRDALAIVMQICDALQYAHDEGIVHRDIKPENILLDKRGRVKIADFGLAKLLGQTTHAGPLTHTHQVMGTLGYMAPEQMEGSREVDHRADLYALGVVFYELLTGELPMGRFAPPSHMVQVDVRIDEVVFRTLEKEPERRYQYASQIKQDVERISSPAQPAVRSAADGWMGMTLPGIALLILGVVDLLLLFVGFLDAVQRQNIQAREHIAWVMLVMTDLALGAGVLLAGVLMLWRKLWLLAVLGALLAVLPLGPCAFLLKPADALEQMNLGQLLQIAERQGIKLNPSHDDEFQESFEAKKLRQKIMELMKDKPQAPAAPIFFGRDLVLITSLLAIPAGLWAFLVLLRPDNRILFTTTPVELVRSIWKLLSPRFVNATSATIALCGLGLLGCFNWAGLYQVHFKREFPPPGNFAATASWHGQVVIAVLGVTALGSLLALRGRTRGVWLGSAGLVCCALLMLFADNLNESLPGMLVDQYAGVTPALDDAARFSVSDIISYSHHLADGFALTFAVSVGLIFLGAVVWAAARKDPTTLDAADADVSNRLTALGLLGVVLAGLGVGDLTWLISGAVRHDYLRIPITGGAASALTWQIVGTVLLTGGLALLVCTIRGARTTSPHRSVFFLTAVVLLLVGTLFTGHVWLTLQDGEPLSRSLGQVIVSPSEAYGWIAGFFTGALAALTLGFRGIQLSRRFWITLLIIVIMLSVLAALIMPTSLKVHNP